MHVGAVRGRYFRENFAQGGIDLVQIVPELVTNADAAIAATGRERGRIQLRFTAPEPALLERWRAQMRSLRVPALLDWRSEVRCSDDGIGVNADVVDHRLGMLGELPEHDGRQRGLFGRGLRDVWLAHGAGRIEGVRDERRVKSWFFPASGDDPYAYLHVQDESAPGGQSGTTVTVPLAIGRLPAEGRLRTLVSHLVQLRPVLEDPTREVLLELPSGSVELVAFPAPAPDAERPLLFDGDVEVTSKITARVTVQRTAQPVPPGMSRATRVGGLVVRSGRAAHESTFGSYEGSPGTRHLYGEVRCDALEELQRAALNHPRPQVVVKVDRSGLNDNHPVVSALYAAIDRVLKPIVADEERRASAHLIRAGGALRARDQVGLRALNDALKVAFDTPGKAAFARGGTPSDKPAAEPGAPPESPSLDSLGPEGPPVESTSGAMPAIRFKQALVRLHPGERRGVTLLIDPAQIAPGTDVHVAVDSGLWINLASDVVPEPVRAGWSRIDANLRVRVKRRSRRQAQRACRGCRSGGRAGRPRCPSPRIRWVREIARKDEDSEVEASFDPESGVVTVYEGRREFKALERAARRSGLSKKRVREYLPYRMLEVEAAANAVYSWAARELLARRLAEERPTDPAEYATTVHRETQALRYRAHEKLMRAFLDDEVFDGRVRIEPERGREGHQTSLLDERK